MLSHLLVISDQFCSDAKSRDISLSRFPKEEEKKVEDEEIFFVCCHFVLFFALWVE